ncbi:MAG: acyltransferase [Gemmatimonadota bacterium]
MRARGAADYQAVLQGTRLPGLDGLRAIAVFTVMLGHFGSNAPGDLGVSAFFVLSGFLITWLLLKEYDATGDISIRHFYLRRSLRIFPAYYAFLAFSIGLDLIRGDSRIRPVIVPALLYFVNYYNAFHGHPSNSVAHAWSLAVEEQFYLLWPLGFLLLARLGTRALVRGLLIAITIVLAWRCIAWYQLGFGTAYVYNVFETRFDNLAVGCLLAVLSRGGFMIRLAPRLASAGWLPLVTLGALLISRLVAPSAYHYGPGFTVDAVLVAIFMVQVLQLATHPLWSWLEHPLMRYLGSISYPLYLYHQWGLGIGHKAAALPQSVQFVIGVLCSVLLASGSYFVIERPFLKLKRRFHDPPRGSAPQASAGLASAQDPANA